MRLNVNFRPFILFIVWVVTSISTCLTMAELSANGRNDETNADLFSKTATEARSQSLEDALAHARTNKYWPPSLRFVSPADKERYLIICLRGWVRKTEDGSWSVLLRLRRTKRRLTGEGESFNKKDCIIYNWPGSTVEMAWRFGKKNDQRGSSARADRNSDGSENSCRAVEGSNLETEDQ